MGGSGHTRLASIPAGHDTPEIIRTPPASANLHQGPDQVSHHLSEKAIAFKNQMQVIRIGAL
jgi:hypothetical protein